MDDPTAPGTGGFRWLHHQHIFHLLHCGERQPGRVLHFQWAARLGEFGFPVYEVRPGVIKTDMTSGGA
jgi:hypothetical protein